MKNVLVTGGKGQLATCLFNKANTIEGYNFVYVDLDELDITNQVEVHSFFDQNDISYCVNCAAYTAVDKAEEDAEIAIRVNEDGARILAEACKRTGARMIHISTDFVFDGSQTSLYTENDAANPISVYGVTKLKGEKAVSKFLEEHFIIRTSWLYSEYGHNFLRTMLRLGKEKEQLSVVCDQIGTPTYAGDLATIVLQIITENISKFGTYHYSNEGVASWYDFAKCIFETTNLAVEVLPIKSGAYPTPAKRPKFSVMDKSKIKADLKITIPYWRDSLNVCIKNLESEN